VEAQTTSAYTRGLYYGPPFVIGGNNYSAASPNALLFSQISSDYALSADFALNRLGEPTPETYTTTTIRCHVNLKKSTVKLTRVGPPENMKYQLSFQLDADLPCCVSVYTAAFENQDSNRNV